MHLQGFASRMQTSQAAPKAAACFERRQYISRFTVRGQSPFLRVSPFTNHTPRLPGTQGSAGTAVVTSSEALLWTDGRYFLQAETELGSEWRLMRAGVPGTPEVAAYLKTTLPLGARVGIDPQVRMPRRDGWWHALLLFTPPAEALHARIHISCTPPAWLARCTAP